jgi:predicted  nucleic acid-binding Zn-ribbon protein
VERIIFEREKKVKTNIDKLSQDIKDYNLKLSITSMAKGDVTSNQIDSLNQEKEIIQSKIIQTLSELEDLRRNVIEEIETFV